jgi:rhamnosyl/mannosyltransferase
MRHGMPVGAIVHEKKGYPKPNPDDFGGAKIYSVPTFGQLLYAPVAPSFPWRLRQAIRDFKPDILHLHMPNTSVFAALLLPEARAIPWVVHWHADVDSTATGFAIRLAYPSYRVMESAVLGLSVRIIATTYAYLVDSSPLKKWASKSTVIPLCVDPERLPWPHSEQLQRAIEMWPMPSQPRILSVGRLVDYKGFESLISAATIHKSANILIVGSGPSRRELERAIDNAGVSGRVKLAGSLNQIDLQACFAAADLFCLTSLNRSEAFGVALLEAARYNCDILASDISGSGVAEVARSLARAKTFQPGDVASLSQALRAHCADFGGGDLKNRQVCDLGKYLFSRDTLHELLVFYRECAGAKHGC